MASHGHPGEPRPGAVDRLRSESPGDAGDLVRRCRRCRQSLDGIRGHFCPACGEGFDFQDPRTFRVDRLEQVLLLHGNAGKVRMAELSLLRSGIAAVVQDDYNAAGGPTAHLWVARDDVDAAMDALAAPPASGSAWTCACGEPHEGQFAECWSCGSERPPIGGPAMGRSPEPAVAAPPVERAVSVPDVGELTEWYAEWLGLVPVATDGSASDEEVRYDLGGATLRVRRWDQAASDDASGDAEADDPRPVFTFVVASIEASAERLVVAGADFVDQGPIPVPGGRSAVFIDPFGVVHELVDDRVEG